MVQGAVSDAGEDNQGVHVYKDLGNPANEGRLQLLQQAHIW